MRGTGDMMEDSFSEDTMMECSGDDADLDDLVDLTDGISHSAPTIRDAAERLLTLLGVDSDENDDSSSSEDEGVELDGDSDDNDEEIDESSDEPQNTRLLHQLAASLAKELKYSQKHGSKTSTWLTTLERGSSAKTNRETVRSHDNDQIQCMEVANDIFHQDDAKSSKCGLQVEKSLPHKKSSGRRGHFGASSCFDGSDSMSTGKHRNEERFRQSKNDVNEEAKTVLSMNSGITDSWSIGWDSCASEAIRYLIEDEGLSPHHPTVLAMKSHLETQRERALAQYAV